MYMYNVMWQEGEEGWGTYGVHKSRSKAWVGSAVKISVDAHFQSLLYHLSLFSSRNLDGCPSSSQYWPQFCGLRHWRIWQTFHHRSWRSKKVASFRHRSNPGKQQRKKTARTSTGHYRADLESSKADWLVQKRCQELKDIDKVVYDSPISLQQRQYPTLSEHLLVLEVS